MTDAIRKEIANVDMEEERMCGKEMKDRKDVQRMEAVLGGPFWATESA